MVPAVLELGRKLRCDIFQLDNAILQALDSRFSYFNLRVFVDCFSCRFGLDIGNRRITDDAVTAVLLGAIKGFIRENV